VRTVATILHDVAMSRAGALLAALETLKPASTKQDRACRYATTSAKIILLPVNLPMPSRRQRAIHIVGQQQWPLLAFQRRVKRQSKHPLVAGQRLQPHRSLNHSAPSPAERNAGIILDITASPNEAAPRHRADATSRFRFPHSLQPTGSGSGKPIKIRDRKAIKQRDRAHGHCCGPGPCARSTAYVTSRGQRSRHHHAAAYADLGEDHDPTGSPSATMRSQQANHA
jgi:hypothetical protein